MAKAKLYKKPPTFSLSLVAQATPLHLGRGQRHNRNLTEFNASITIARLGTKKTVPTESNLSPSAGVSVNQMLPANTSKLLISPDLSNRRISPFSMMTAVDDGKMARSLLAATRPGSASNSNELDLMEIGEIIAPSTVAAFLFMLPTCHFLEMTP
jgi:hypothetical protein